MKAPATRRAQAQHNKGEAFTASADDGYSSQQGREEVLGLGSK
jgi:hypothetical protein